MTKKRDSINLLHPVQAYGDWHPYIPTGYAGFIDHNGMAWITPTTVYNGRSLKEGIPVDDCFPSTVECLQDGYELHYSRNIEHLVED